MLEEKRPLENISLNSFILQMQKIRPTEVVWAHKDN